MEIGQHHCNIKQGRVSVPLPLMSALDCQGITAWQCWFSELLDNEVLNINLDNPDLNKNYESKQNQRTMLGEREKKNTRQSGYVWFRTLVLQYIYTGKSSLPHRQHAKLHEFCVPYINTKENFGTTGIYSKLAIKDCICNTNDVANATLHVKQHFGHEIHT